MDRTKQIRLCGSGGQGIIIAGTILGRAAVHDGQWVAGSNSYGAQARGGLAVSELVVSKKPIAFPHVIESDVLIALSQEAYNKYITNMRKETGIIIYDTLFVSPQELRGVKQVAVAATDTAIRELDDSQVANITILGAAASLTEIVSRQALIYSLDENIPERFRALNLRALDAGYKMGEKLRKEANSPWL